MKKWTILAYVIVFFLVSLVANAEGIDETVNNSEFKYISAVSVDIVSACEGSTLCFLDELQIFMTFQLPCNDQSFHYSYEVVHGEVPTVVVSALVKNIQSIECQALSTIEKSIYLPGYSDVNIQFIGVDE